MVVDDELNDLISFRAGEIKASYTAAWMEFNKADAAHQDALSRQLSDNELLSSHPSGFGEDKKV